MDIIYRQVRKEDGYQWYTLLNKVWRVAYKNIFPEEVFDERDIGVLKDNVKARKVYESWGGTLSEHEQDFERMNVGYPESFYTFEIDA